MSTVKKNVRHNLENKMTNSYYKSRLNTMKKKLIQKLSIDNKSEDTKNFVNEFYSFIRKLVNKNIIHTNKMSRLQSNIAKQLNK